MELSASSLRQDPVADLDQILRELDETLTGVLGQSVAFDKPLMQVSTTRVINKLPSSKSFTLKLAMSFAFCNSCLLTHEVGSVYKTDLQGCFGLQSVSQKHY